MYATWLAGDEAVPVDETLLSRQVEHIVEHSGSRLMLSLPGPSGATAVPWLPARAGSSHH
jgi:hypothetical protein